MALAVALPAAAASAWTPAGSMHHARVRAASAVLVDGRVLMVGGERGAVTAELYDPRSRTWSMAPDPPSGFGQGATALRLGNSRVLLLAPSQRPEPGAPPAVTSFDSELGWLPIPVPTGGGSGGFAVAALDADNVLVAGGIGASGPAASASIYGAHANAWFAQPPMPVARTGALAAPLGDGGALIAGGAGFGGLDRAPLDSAVVFAGAAGWRAAGSYPGLAFAYQLLPIGAGKVLAVIGGTRPGMAVYDEAANNWTATPAPPFPQPAPGVTLTDGKAFFAGGSAVATAGAELYDPGSNTWSSLQPLPEPTLRPNLVALSRGAVALAAGGSGRSGILASTEVFGGPQPVAAPATRGIPEAGWIAAGMALLLLGLLGLLGFSRSRRPSRLGLGGSRLALQLGGVIVLTWGLLAAAHLLVAFQGGGNLTVPGFFNQPLAAVLWQGTARSLALIAFATLGATVAGLGAAVAVVGLKERRLLGIELTGAVLLVIPTFLLAILVQELQALIFGKTGLVVAAGYGDVNGVQVFWASVVLAIRPATYLYRHGRAVLERETAEDYVRTAEAKGLEWRQVVRRHLLRAGGSALVATWSNSFRLMIGALPLVEYFFGYPGLGRILVQSIGIHYGVKPVVLRGDIAIGLVVILALFLITVEMAAGGVQRWLDPRLRTLEAAK